ncbi:MAG: ABC transporter ATP-binding protein/permease [Lachnospiraceae bacterium]|nr:ABC transporter ATP-binding protein/permease [Lachnospiraceae bacterium]
MKKQSKVIILLRMIKLVKPLTGFMIMAVFFGTMGFLAAEFIPILGGFAVINALGGNTCFSLKTIFILLPILAILRAVFRLSEQRTNHYIAFTLLAIIRDKVFKALRKLCPAKLEGKDKGDLISLITSDVELLEVFYAHTISPICIAIVTELLMCVFIGYFHPLLGVVAMAAYLSVGVLLPIIISKRSGTMGDDLRAKSGELSAHMLENIRGIDDTMQYSYGNVRLYEITEKTNELSKKQGLLSRLTGTNMALANTMILISDIVMLAVCALLYQNGKVGFDGFLIPLIALMSSFGPVTVLAALGTTLQSTVASGARVLAVIDEVPVTEDIAGKEETDFTGAKVQNVSFSYGNTDSETKIESNQSEVLKNVSLDVNKNKIIGIVGKSGCGKSTLLKLLMRFWKVNEGEINISNKNIEEINTDNLREIESYMTQETILFKDTIANNIRIGKLDATDEEVIEACRKASVHDFIMTLPNGYETEVGELGSTLSGGERQRIGLARAFLHDAPFILLDEPTSNLDSLNEAVVLKSLKESAKEKTILLVSHRQSTMRIADEVIAMDGGRVS